MDIMIPQIYDSPTSESCISWSDLRCSELLSLFLFRTTTVNLSSQNDVCVHRNDFGDLLEALRHSTICQMRNIPVEVPKSASITPSIVIEYSGHISNALCISYENTRCEGR